MTGYQTLDQTLPLDERPYIQLPALSASALWAPLPWPAFKTGFDSELVDFTRASGETGWRLDARPQLGLDVTGPGYYLRPNVAWDYTRYRCSRPSRPTPARPAACRSSTSMPACSSSARAAQDTLRNITLQPRLKYVYIPYRDQSGLPVFDTGMPDPNLIELFRPNRFVGLDRIGDANAVTLGLTTQVFQSASGVRYLSATVGQSYDLSAPRVRLPAADLPT